MCSCMPGDDASSFFNAYYYFYFSAGWVGVEAGDMLELIPFMIIIIPLINGNPPFYHVCVL